jgi:serine phosphatase RsbU (regulator of sigma subunit)
VTVPAGLPVPDGELPGDLGDVVLVLDDGGTIQLANAAARLLFPDLVPGRAVRVGDVVPALAGNHSDRRTSHGELRLAWRRHTLDSGYLIWWGRPDNDVTEDTGPSRRWWTDLGRILEGTLTPDRIAGDLARLAVPALADCCVVLMPAALSRFRWWRCAIQETGDSGAITQGRVSDRAVRTESVLADALDAGPLPRQVSRAELVVADWLLPAGFGPVGDAAVVPVRGPGPAMGLLVLANRADRADRTGVAKAIDLDVLTEFARQADTALDAAIRFGELATVTSGLESSLLPAELPDVPGVRIAAAYRPAQAGLRVGGDFYDVRVDENAGAMWALGDACGHGPEAASLAGHVRSCFGALSLVERAPSKLLALLNQAIRPTSGSRFTTAVVGRVEPVAGDGVRLTVGRAGHPPPLVLRSDGTVEDLMVPGGLLGVFPDVEFEEHEITLAGNETCLVYSDGVLEARQGGDEGEQFGLDRLRRVLASYRAASVAELVEGVHGEVIRWLAGRHHDDITLLAIQAGPTGPVPVEIAG